MIAIIPARMNSKRIKHKNMVMFKGKPLIQHTIEHAVKCKSITDVYVNTDDPDIKILALGMKSKKIFVMKRPDHLVDDYTTTEKVIEHTLDMVEYSRYVILMQCTSPFRNSGDIDKALEKMKHEQADSLYFGYPIERFLWKNDRPINYSYRKRQMTQDVKWDVLVECGDYIFTQNLFNKTKCRLGGNITNYIVNRKCSIDINDKLDLKIGEVI